MSTVLLVAQKTVANLGESEERLGRLLSIIRGSEDEPGSTSSLYCIGSQLREVGRRSLPGKRESDQVLREVGTYIQAGLTFGAEGDEVEVAEGVSFKAIAAREFAAFRARLGLDPRHYLASLAALRGGATQPSGKSGSLFWFSEDQRYVMKTITKREADKLTAMLDEYIDHVLGAQDSGSHSLLPRFFGLYLLRLGRQALWTVVMNNVLVSQRPHRVYDLKGTTEDRFVRPEPGRVMKDLNFSDHAVCFSESEVATILEVINADAEFLRDQGVMDYSLLLGVYEGVPPSPAAVQRSSVPEFRGVEVVEQDEKEAMSAPARFRMGIIDVLVEWTLKKKAAHWMKKPTLGCCKEIDTEPPDYYKDRFVDYLEGKIISAID